MWTAFRHQAKPATASLRARGGSTRPALAPQAARPVAMHDISRVPIADVAQRKAASGRNVEAYRAPNRTGLPDRLKAGVEALSGLSIDSVRVHFGSAEPARLHSHAFTRGADIHLAPGQERHLPHEAWHAVQQARGEVTPTTAIADVPINDDGALEHEADAMGSRAMLTEAAAAQSALPSPAASTRADRPAGESYAPAARAESPGVVQMMVEVGGVLYKRRKRGHTPKLLVAKIEQEATDKYVTLKKGWKKAIKDQAKEKDEKKTVSYKDWDEIIEKFKKPKKGTKRKLKLKEQDKQITELVKGVGEPVKKRARTIAYESEKASKSVSESIQDTDEYKETKKELEALPAAKIGAANEVTKTNNSAFVFEALDKSKDMKRLDFNFHGTPIVTHGYESMGDRTVDASTLKPFGYGPVKVGGDDVGSYSQILKKANDIRGDANKVLTTLEMLRIPKTSAMTGLKRDLYEQGKTDLSEAMAIDSKKSNVEFLGAVGGSGLNKGEKQRMQQQQVLSNAHILDDYADRFPNFQIGSQTADAKPRTSPKDIKDALDKLEKDKDKPSKKEFRRKLRRAIASLYGVENYDSSSEVSDYDENSYT